MKVNKIIEDLKFCKGIFDYTITPNDIEKLVNYIEQLQQENKELKEQKKELKLEFELYKDNHTYKNYEFERKENILKELRSWLEELGNCDIYTNEVLSKLNKLEDGKNDSKRDV